MKSKTMSRRHPVTRTPALRDIETTPQDHYRREKARRAALKGPNDEIMEQARREYLAQLEAAAIKGKGGRPKKKPAGSADDTHEEEGPDEIEIDLTEDE